jgi:hypothetical protein
MKSAINMKARVETGKLTLKRLFFLNYNSKRENNKQKWTGSLFMGGKLPWHGGLE